MTVPDCFPVLSPVIARFWIPGSRMQNCFKIRWRAGPGGAFAPAAHHRSRCPGTKGMASPVITKGPELFDNNKV